MNLKKQNKPFIIKGGFFEDQRGRLDFVNDFNLNNVKRFYFSMNNELNYFRAWQGHKIESRWFFCVSGSFEISLIEINNWDKPSDNLDILKYRLTADNPEILYVPNGYVNGFQSLEENSKLMIFSDYKLEENPNDNYRFDNTKWKK